MSFVGIIFVEMKIIGFGDSKSSICRDGRYFHDVQRGAIRKVFSNPKFISTCYGTNEIPIMNGGTLDYKRVEDWMEENVDKFNTPRDLLCST